MFKVTINRDEKQVDPSGNVLTSFNYALEARVAYRAYRSTDYKSYYWFDGKVRVYFDNIEFVKWEVS